MRSAFIIGRPTVQVTGLQFPSNGSSTVRFHFNTPPTISPLTLVWKLYPIQQTGYYTTYFWGEEGGAVITTWGYHGCHPYPVGGASGTVHNWEVASEGGDDIVDENGNDTTVAKGRWHTQAAIIRNSGTYELDIDFYWDLATSATRLINHVTISSPRNNLPSNPGLFFGDAPWSESNEMLSGIIRGIQVYDAALTLQQIQDRMDLSSDSAVVSADPGSLWYTNLNPTPSDISDKSGNGNNPSWANANRPTLWTP